MKDLSVGLSSSSTFPVAREQTVPFLLPAYEEVRAMPEVLATGFLVGMVELACMRALASYLEPAEMSVGTQLDLTHEAPTLPGDEVTVAIRVTAVDGRQLVFEVEARDGSSVVCRGTHRRAVVERDRFEGRLAKLRARD